MFTLRLRFWADGIHDFSRVKYSVLEIEPKFNWCC